MRLSVAPILAAAAVLLSMPTGLTGQRATIAEGDLLYAQLRGKESLRAYERVVAREAENFEALWRAARGALVLGDMEKQNPAARDALYRKARGYAARAIAVDSLRIDGHYWLASAKGREALYASFSTAARLAGEVYDEANGLLARDSLYAGAHHVLGVLNYEVMKLPRIKRWLGRKVLGNEGLYNTSWENGRRYLERAVELDPEMILFGYDLARFYETRGEYQAARAEFQRLVTLERTHPMDERIQASAEQHIKDLSAPIERADTTDGGG
jgi:tetratricopeptide (TPR) repeat protein